MDEESKKVSKPMTEEELEQRRKEIFAGHEIDPLVQQAAWDSVWDFLLERAIARLRERGEL